MLSYARMASRYGTAPKYGFVQSRLFSPAMVLMERDIVFTPLSGQKRPYGRPRVAGGPMVALGGCNGACLALAGAMRRKADNGFAIGNGAKPACFARHVV